MIFNNNPHFDSQRDSFFSLITELSSEKLHLERITSRYKNPLRLQDNLVTISSFLSPIYLVKNFAMKGSARKRKPLAFLIQSRDNFFSLITELSSEKHRVDRIFSLQKNLSRFSDLVEHGKPSLGNPEHRCQSRPKPRSGCIVPGKHFSRHTVCVSIIFTSGYARHSSFPAGTGRLVPPSLLTAGCLERTRNNLDKPFPLSSAPVSRWQTCHVRGRGFPRKLSAVVVAVANR